MPRTHYTKPSTLETAAIIAELRFYDRQSPEYRRNLRTTITELRSELHTRALSRGCFDCGAETGRECKPDWGCTDYGRAMGSPGVSCTGYLDDAGHLLHDDDTCPVHEATCTVTFEDAEESGFFVSVPISAGDKRGEVIRRAKDEAISLVEAGEWDAELPLRIAGMSGIWNYGGTFVRDATADDIRAMLEGSSGLVPSVSIPNDTDRFDITADDITSAESLDAIPKETPSGFKLTVTQRHAVTLRVLDCEESWHNPCSVYVTQYGTTPDVLAIIRADGNPSPDPIVALWHEGCEYHVSSEDDLARWQETLPMSEVVVQRKDDVCYLISPTGRYYRAFTIR